MARIKLKIGEREIEVESRDLYVDNQVLSQIITKISNHLPEDKTQAVYDTEHVSESQLPPTPTPAPIPIPPTPQVTYSPQSGLEYLYDAEVYEPEFTEPTHITIKEIPSKLNILESDGFFESQRTVTEILQQLREYGWSANPLDVSKTLVKMAFNKELAQNFSNDRIHYFQPIPTLS